MNAWKPTRRSVAKALGLGAAATFLPLLRQASSRAATDIPTRLLLFWAGHGVPRHIYNFKAMGGGAATSNDFVFPAMREPLNAIKSDLIALSGVSMLSAAVDGTAPSNAHYEGETHSLAATNRANADTAGGPSIDQYVAKAINSPNPVTRFQSLSLALQVDGNVTATKVCTQASGQVVSLDVNPSSVYKRLFGNFMPPATMPPASGPSPAEIAAQQDKSVLDFVLNDFAAVKPKLSVEQQAKLEAHASAVRDLEKSLQLGGGTGTFTPGAGCADPTQAVTEGTGNSYPGTAAMFQANITAMSRLVQTSFACDLTRVALLCLADPFSDTFGYQSGAFGTTDAHDLIHKTSYNAAGSLRDNPDAMAAVTRWHQWESKQFVSLLDLLRQIPETDGTTMLDHTIVLMCGQIAEHGHELDQLPWVIGGGSAVGFQGGRYLQFNRAPHNDLFVSLAQAMGVQTDTFGNPDVCTGPLAGLRV